MNKYIVTTTINMPTTATLEFCKKKEWNFIIIGDLKTPHNLYTKLVKKYNNVTYLSPSEQKRLYSKLSDAIGWNTVERRNIGYLHAFKCGAEIIATVDDDNIPLPNWGENIYVGKTILVDCYNSENGIFDPLSITKENYLWHRGYPIELLATKNKVKYVGKIKRKVLVQADLWNGDPDIDAIARITYKPNVKYNEIKKPFCSNNISPFNSQNTFLSREVISKYTLFPYIGRMEDIWGSYVMQHYFPNSVIYNTASVLQERNAHDVVKDLELEIIGYRNTYKLLNNLKNFEEYLPSKTKKFYKIYKNSFI